MMDAVCLLFKEVVLLGDFNTDLLKPNETWLQKLQNYNLY